jgi:ketosteroid isomerase-like protein
VSEEAVELVHEMFALWNSGERELDERLFQPGFEVHSALTGGVYRGEDEVLAWTREIDQQFSDWEVVADEVEALTDERVLVRGEIRMIGRESGLEFRQPASWLVEVTGGRIRSLRNFADREEAASFAEREW